MYMSGIGSHHVKERRKGGFAAIALLKNGWGRGNPMATGRIAKGLKASENTCQLLNVQKKKNAFK